MKKNQRNKGYAVFLLIARIVPLLSACACDITTKMDATIKRTVIRLEYQNTLVKKRLCCQRHSKNSKSSSQQRILLPNVYFTLIIGALSNS